MIDAGLNLYKIADAFFQLTDNSRVLKALPLLGLGNALRKASLDISATGSIIRANQLGLLGEEENRVRSQYCSLSEIKSN